MGGSPPDLIIADYSLPEGRSGLELIATLRSAFGGQIAAFLISGDTSPDRIREVRSSGLHLLYKPVTPMALRAMLVRYLKMGGVSIAPDISPSSSRFNGFQLPSELGDRDNGLGAVSNLQGS